MPQHQLLDQNQLQNIIQLDHKKKLSTTLHQMPGRRIYVLTTHTFLYLNAEVSQQKHLIRFTFINVTTGMIVFFFNSNSMFFIVFSAILIGPLVKLNGFYTSIKTRAYEYLISALISQC